MNFLDTVKGSMLEGFYPAGWDLERIDKCCQNPPESVLERQPFWNPEFTPVPCDELEEFGVYMGHEIAMQIKKAEIVVKNSE